MTDPNKKEWKEIIAELVSHFCSPPSPPHKKPILDNLSILFGGLGAFAALISGAIAYGQYTTVLNVQRPNIIVENISTSFPRDISKLPNHYPIKFSYRNYGASPALITGFVLEGYVNGELPLEPDYRNNDNRHLVVPPSYGDDVQNALIPISREDKDAILNGAKQLYIYGMVYYTDVNKGNHHTGFAYRLYSDENGGRYFSPIGGASFWQYD